MCLQNQSGLRTLQQSHSKLEGELQASREIWKQQFDVLHQLVLESPALPSGPSSVAPTDSYLVKILRQQVEDLYKQVSVLNKVVIKGKLKEAVGGLTEQLSLLEDRQSGEYLNLSQKATKCEQELIHVQFQVEDLTKKMQQVEQQFGPYQLRVAGQEGYVKSMEANLVERNQRLEEELFQVKRQVHMLTVGFG